MKKDDLNKKQRYALDTMFNKAKELEKENQNAVQHKE